MPRIVFLLAWLASSCLCLRKRIPPTTLPLESQTYVGINQGAVVPSPLENLAILLLASQSTHACARGQARVAPPAASSSVIGFQETPRAFVREVIVPWCERETILHIRHRNESYNAQVNLSTFGFERAALRYEREIGIPQRIFHEWVSFVFHEDEAGDLSQGEYEEILAWAENDNVCIEGGDFDWIEFYCRLVDERIRETKETILTAIESSEILDLPLELEAIPRDELLNSHEHNELFQNSWAMLLDKQKVSREIVVPWTDWLRVPWMGWFVSINSIRTEYYFPYETWKGHAASKDLEKVFGFQGLLESSSYGAVQKHLVKHLDEWKLNLDSIPKLHEEIAAPLLFRDCGDSFLSEGAMEMCPKDLLYYEREAILNMPFAGLDDLDNTPRVKVLRTAREVHDMEQALNTTLFIFDHTSLEISPWGSSKAVAVALCNENGTPVAIGEFHFRNCRRGSAVLISRGSSVTIMMQNKREPIDDNLISLCEQYHNDFLHGWRMEKLEKEAPDWWLRV